MNLIQLIIGFSTSEAVYAEGPNCTAAPTKQRSRPCIKRRARLLTAPPGTLVPFKGNPGREGGKGGREIYLRWCLKKLDGAAHWRAFVLLSTGEVWWSAHPGVRPVCGQCPVRKCNLCLHDLLQAPCYTLLTPRWKHIAQDDTAVRFSTLYQHLRFKSIIGKTFLWLIFSRALSRKTSLKQSWCHI